MLINDILSETFMKELVRKRAAAIVTGKKKKFKDWARVVKAP